MSMQTVQLDLPQPLYHRLKERADRSQRSVETELIDVLTTAVPLLDDLPTELADAVNHLAVLDDDSLWRIARARLPDDAAAELEALHFKKQRSGLTEAESQRAAELIQQAERTMLLRARAAALLKERGHAISELAGNP